ncbi:MAG TPA: TonB-dependent receptor plug domain-containing protein, partial [Gemmatimonadales bacterium]|nr:TonB-dependent receptor plug domain-containing protein [Gemmatimonadales bacterium]
MHHLLLRSLVGSFLAISTVHPLRAQAPGEGTVLVTVSSDAGHLSEALVRVDSTDRSFTADAAGRVRIPLAPGRHTLLVGHIGYAPKQAVVNVVEGRTLSVTVFLVAEEVEVEALTVSATRTERLAGETPIRVEVTPPEEVNEKTGMSPGGIAMLLTESSGIRVQPTSPSLGTGAVRIQGLPGQYTAMLADGLPLYGGASSSLGPLSISPVDLARVEVIKGAASALYGGQALGGVI